jgi:hypothetical protein
MSFDALDYQNFGDFDFDFNSSSSSQQNQNNNPMSFQHSNNKNFDSYSSSDDGNNFKHKPSISFSSKMSVVLIPCRQDYSTGGVSNDLWWQPGDYSFFKDDARSEIIQAMRLKQLDRKSAIRELYHTNRPLPLPPAPLPLPSSSSSYGLPQRYNDQYRSPSPSVISETPSVSETFSLSESQSQNGNDDPITELDALEFLDFLHRDASFLSQQLLEDDLSIDDDDLRTESDRTASSPITTMSDYLPINTASPMMNSGLISSSRPRLTSASSRAVSPPVNNSRPIHVIPCSFLLSRGS